MRSLHDLIFSHSKFCLEAIVPISPAAHLSLNYAQQEESWWLLNGISVTANDDDFCKSISVISEDDTRKSITVSDDDAFKSLTVDDGGDLLDNWRILAVVRNLYMHVLIGWPVDDIISMGGSGMEALTGITKCGGYLQCFNYVDISA